MADDNAASPDRNRNRPAEERPEAALARDLIRTEYRLRDGRLGAGRDTADTPGAWRRLTERLRRLVDRLLGRDRAGVGGPDADSAGSWQPAPAQMPARTSVDGPSPAAAGPSAHPDVVRLEQRIGRLSPLRHEAFEDAVLHLLRTDDRWRKAFERSPESMPAVARYATEAHLREALRETSPATGPREPASTREDLSRTAPVTRMNATTESSTQTETQAGTRSAAEALDAARDRIMAADARQFAALRARWERAAAPERPGTAPAPGGTGAGPRAPGQDEMADGQAFRAAQRAQWERLGTGATASPSPTEALDGEAFRAAAEARREQLGNSPTTVPRSTDAFDGHAFLAAERAAQGTGRAPDTTGPVVGALTSAPPSPVAPVSPQTPAASPPSLLSGEGHAAVRSSLDTLQPFLTSTAPGTRDAPAGPHRPAPVHRPTTPTTTPQKRGRT
ncbi:hypothetical protein [Streptomyces variegatus]|uniref:hypothetical protein n=1 Tax=Streptomyces variegatus TaxID=284040 RepID=UPI003C3030EF